MMPKPTRNWRRLPGLQVPLGRSAVALMTRWEINALVADYGSFPPARWGALCARFLACTTPAALFTARDRIRAELDAERSAG